MEKLLAFMDHVWPLPPELREHLAKILRTRIFQKKEFLLRAGHISRHIYFIEAGLVRSYYMLGERDISAWFMKEGDLVISINSFFSQVPSSEFIQALEDTVVHYISYDELEAAYAQFISLNANGRRLLQHYYCRSEERNICMRSMKARERYAFLLEREPELLQRVPRKYLATYLGVTEVTLSNINHKSPT